MPDRFSLEKREKGEEGIYLLFQSSRLNRSLTAALIAALRLGYIFCLTSSSNPSRYASGSRTVTSFIALLSTYIHT